MCVLLSVVIFCSNSEQFFYFGICCLPYCCVIVIFYCTAIRATVRELLGRETVVAGIAVIVVHLAILHGVFQKIIVEFRKNWQLISFCREDVQLKIYEVFFNFDFLGNLSGGEYITVCIQEFLQKCGQGRCR